MKRERRQNVFISPPEIRMELKRDSLKLVEAWIEIHKEELMANWDLAISGNSVFQIEPLK